MLFVEIWNKAKNFEFSEIDVLMYRVPTMPFAGGLKPLENDVDVMNMVKCIRALALENCNATLFYNSKNHFIIYTILFYNTSTSQTSIFIKIFFFKLSLLFLSTVNLFPGLSKFQQPIFFNSIIMRF